MIGHAGFHVTRLLEPRPDPTTLATCRQLEDCARVPYFLIPELRKKAEG